jgi:4'-phosphopantetheinyl transferase EntD
MKAAQMAAIEHMTGDVYRVGCDIERELNAANAIIRQQQLLDEENLRLQERIKRLVKVGDYLDAYVSLVRENRTVKQLWTQAKEAKP